MNAEPGHFLTQPIPPLYLRMIPQECDNLFFIGLFQPIGCIWTLAEQQAQVAALQICGRLTRPTDLGQRIRRESKKQLSFDASDRHRIEVDAIELNKALASEIRGAKT